MHRDTEVLIWNTATNTTATATVAITTAALIPSPSDGQGLRLHTFRVTWQAREGDLGRVEAAYLPREVSCALPGCARRGLPITDTDVQVLQLVPEELRVPVRIHEEDHEGGHITVQLKAHQLLWCHCSLLVGLRV